MTIHKEGHQILLTTLLAGAVLTAAVRYVLPGLPWLTIAAGTASLIVFLLFLQFFRLPSRTNRSAPNELVAPCDGKVVVIEEVEEPEFFKDKRIQVSIFMSPVNVHANWAPCEGRVVYSRYHPGKYLVAWHPKSSTENERTTVVFEQAPGKQVMCRQIAGAVARRIICYAKEGLSMSRNDEFGFIKFGSRVDIFLPPGTEVVCEIGNITRGNETVIARWKG
ncbi:MAG: phosphatidylserine decarboxylase family protein [Flavobacteriales bacterium]